MKPFIAFAITVLIIVLLAVWRPDSDSPLTLVRAYLLVLIGAMLTFFILIWALRKLGFGELTLGDGLIFAFLGAGTALGAYFRLPLYWEVASGWPIFARMSDRVRHGVLTLAGIAIMAGGIHEVLAAHKAYMNCRHDVAVSLDSHERLQVLARVPDPGLTPYRGAGPFTCEQLLRVNEPD